MRTQTARVGAVGRHWTQLTAQDLAEPSLAVVWQLCLDHEYALEALVAGLSAWIGDPARHRVLDCACGFGFPALELIARGYDVTCTDGSPAMLRRFERNAERAGLSVRPREQRWERLGAEHAGAFDVVLCRGSSLIYAGTWDADAPPHRESLAAALEGMARCLRPGGRLYVDTTRGHDLAATRAQWVAHPRRIVDGRLVRLRECVDADLRERTRRWRSWLEVDGRLYTFARRSHHLTHGELVGLLRSAGLVDVRRTEIPGEHYAVFTGRRTRR